MPENVARKTGPYADVLMDRWFKRTFGWKPAKPLMMLFLKELIPERDIVDLSFGPQEHVNPVESGKDVRMDIDCTDRDGSRFIVEMQLASQSGFYERAVFNSAFALQEQIPVGRRSFSFPPVYFIGVMDFSVHEGSDQVLFRYNLQERTSHEKMTDCLQFLFLELPNCRKALTPEASVLDNFCYVLRNVSRMDRRPEGLEGEIFDLLFNSVEISKFAGSEKEKYFEDMTTKEDINRMIAFAEDKGEQRGMEKGMEKGMEQGIEKEKLSLAKRMLEKGYDVETIAELTELSVPAIQALK